MLRSIKILVGNYTTKDGREFSKATCKGQYLPLATAEAEKRYVVKFTKKSLTPMPEKSGVYEVAFEDNGIWIDTRPECEGKDIVRINAVRIVFVKNLSKFIEEE